MSFVGNKVTGAQGGDLYTAGDLEVAGRELGLEGNGPLWMLVL